MKPVHVLMVIAVQTLWGFGFAMSKVGLGPFPPMFLMGMRYGLAALVLVWFFRPPWEMMWKVLAAAVVSGAITYGLVYTGLRDLYASTATLLTQLQVPFLALMGVVLLKEKLSLRGLLGMVFAFVGVVLITGEPRVQGNLGAVFIVMAGSLCWALGQIMIRRLGGIGGMRLLAWIATLAAPQLFLGSFILEEGQFSALAAAGWKEWGVILYLGLGMTALAYSMWYHVLSRCEVNRVAPFLLINPLAAIVSSILFLGEELTLLISLGGIIVMIGIGIMTVNPASWRHRRITPVA